MSWSTLSADDVLTEFNPSERVNIINVVGADNLAAIAARVVEEVRGSCLAGGNPIGPLLSIPSQLTGDAIAVTKWRFLLALPQFPSLQTQVRQDAYNEARANLKAIASGEMKTELPADGTALALSTPGNSIEVGDGLNTRFVTRTKMDGL